MIEEEIVKIAAIVALCVIEVYAIKYNINGKLMSIIAAIIGGIAGYQIGVS